ncbi:MAG TPA: uL15m family ribosomal protein [Candidatus Methylacidiphilales bacterium]|nr:uL15m family ribosomal protein [Candidatus Methylacidiphilales bacterium]
MTRKLTVKVNAISAAAKEKIESLGGTVEILPKAKKNAEVAAA